MTVSTVKIQDKDTQKRLSVVQSKDDPTKWGVVILNPDGSPIAPTGNLVKGPDSATDGDIALFDGNTGLKIKDSLKKLSDFVNITADQTIDGIKTFIKEIVLPSKSTAPDSSKTTAPATEAQVAGMVNNDAYASSWDGVNGVAPSKNAVYDKINAMDTTIANKANDNAVVKLTGNQTIQGTKTFETNIVIPSKSALPTTPSNTAPATEGQVQSVKDAIPAVENVLTSTSTTNALSAAQGKALNDSIGTINGKIPSAASTTNLLADTNYVNDSINSITAYYITKNAQGDQFATHAELTAATTFYSGGVVRVPTRNDYCIVLDDENHDHGTTRYIYQNNQWEYQYTVNETALTQAQLDALNSGITSGKVTTYDGYATTISGKQDALTTQTAYSAKGTTTKVPQITTNTLGQVTTITEKNIAFPVTSVNGQTGDITGLQTALSSQTAYSSKGTSTKVPTITTNSLGQVTAITETSIDFPVTSVNGSTGAVTVQATLESGTNIKTINGESVLGSGNLTVSGLPAGGTEGQILMIVSGTPTWVTPVNQGFIMQASGSPTAIKYIWAGTEAQYSSATKNANTHYDTY